MPPKDFWYMAGFALIIFAMFAGFSLLVRASS